MVVTSGRALRPGGSPALGPFIRNFLRSSDPIPGGAVVNTTNKQTNITNQQTSVKQTNKVLRLDDFEITSFQSKASKSRPNHLRTKETLNRV